MHCMHIYKVCKKWHLIAMKHDNPKMEGLRERKRRETLKRITDKAMGLFAANGYEATTLDAIADAADISRRTFFHYFQSKEEILFSWQSGLIEAVRNAVLDQTTERSPLETLHAALSTLTPVFDSDRTVTIASILRSTPQLRASNQAKYLMIEQAACEALGQLWPDPARHTALRMVAMVGIGTMRIAVDRWTDDAGQKTLAEHLNEAFASIRFEL
jgi:AcrR family transcriptional regulator